MTYPRFIKSRNFKYIYDKFARSDYTTTSTTFVPLTFPVDKLDLTIRADEGDVLECHMTIVYPGSAVNRSVDIATIEGGNEINYFSGGATNGIPGLYAHSGYGNMITKASNAYLTVVPSDFGSGYTVTVRPLFRTESGTAYIRANEDGPLFVSIKNLGPAYTS